MSKRVQHNRPTTVAMYGDCELTTGGSASNSRIVTAHLPQETQNSKQNEHSEVLDVRSTSLTHLTRSQVVCYNHTQQ